MQIGQKYGNGFGSSPSVPVLIEIPNFMIEIWKIVRHHVLVPSPDNGHPTVEWGDVLSIPLSVCPSVRPSIRSPPRGPKSQPGRP